MCATVRRGVPLLLQQRASKSGQAGQFEAAHGVVPACKTLTHQFESKEIAWFRLKGLWRTAPRRRSFGSREASGYGTT